MVRADTFGKNKAVIEEKYGDIHRKEMGENTSLNKYGYPDIGNNLYSDLLPYGDWVKINNA